MISEPDNNRAGKAVTATARMERLPNYHRDNVIVASSGSSSIFRGRKAAEELAPFFETRIKSYLPL